MFVSRPFIIYTAQCSRSYTAQFVHNRFLTCITADPADYMLRVKTILAVPVSNLFRVGNMQVLHIRVSATALTVCSCLLWYLGQLSTIRCCMQLLTVYINNLLQGGSVCACVCVCIQGCKWEILNYGKGRVHGLPRPW